MSKAKKPRLSRGQKKYLRRLKAKLRKELVDPEKVKAEIDRVYKALARKD